MSNKLAKGAVAPAEMNNENTVAAQTAPEQTQQVAPVETPKEKKTIGQRIDSFNGRVKELAGKVANSKVAKVAGLVAIVGAAAAGGAVATKKFGDAQIDEYNPEETMDEITEDDMEQLNELAQSLE